MFPSAEDAFGVFSRVWFEWESHVLDPVCSHVIRRAGGKEQWMDLSECSEGDPGRGGAPREGAWPAVVD